MSRALEIREARHDDLDALSALFEAYRAFYGMGSSPLAAAEFLGARLARRDSLIVVAVEGAGPPVGFLQMYPGYSSLQLLRTWYLADLFVATHVRGRGIGRALLQYAISVAEGTGAAYVDLFTAHTNAPARRLYESVGFVKDETFSHYERKAWPSSDTISSAITGSGTLPKDNSRS